MSNITEILNERSDRYGTLMDHSQISQGLKEVLHAAPKWYDMSTDQREALEMIMHKTARILNGDPNYVDNWTDIIGYAKLVEMRLEAGLQK